MRTSADGRDFIKGFESLKLNAYYDIAGVLTIGYGSTGPHVRDGMAISEQEAEDLFTEDLRRFEDAINEHVKVPINQNQFDALVSLSFNIGVRAFLDSTALRRLNRGDYLGCAEAMQWWNKATIDGERKVVRGLVRRREAEAKIFLKPQPREREIINLSDGVVNAPGMTALDQFDHVDSPLFGGFLRKFFRF